MSEVASEMRRLRGEVARLNRRLASVRLSGKVVERDATTRKVRLDLGRDPDTDAVIKSPWVRVQSTGAGAFKGFSLPSVGEQMYLDSPSGVIGADSLATFGAFDDDHPYPQQEADEAVLLERGNVRVSMKEGELTLKSAGSSMTLKAAGPAFAGGAISHDGRNIGTDHKHTNVTPGGGESGPPTAAA